MSRQKIPSVFFFSLLIVFTLQEETSLPQLNLRIQKAAGDSKVWTTSLHSCLLLKHGIGFSIFFKKSVCVAGEMTQHLRELAAPAGNPRVFSSKHPYWAIHKYLQCQLWGIWCLLPSLDTCTQMPTPTPRYA